jgi:hypothetical protein
MHVHTYVCDIKLVIRRERRYSSSSVWRTYVRELLFYYQVEPCALNSQPGSEHIFPMQQINN